MLHIDDLNFTFPENLVATEPVARGSSRILLLNKESDKKEEISWPKLLSLFEKGDTLVLNDSRVLWARLIISKASGAEGEIFFLRTNPQDLRQWQVLTKNLNLKLGSEIALPGNWRARVMALERITELEITSGSPTTTELEDYFEKYGTVPLPPYIKKTPNEIDRERYQTIWARRWGSVAAPTAGLHFTPEHLEKLQEKGVKIKFVTLHVGAGTFLPIETKNVEGQKLHSEFIEVNAEICEAILQTQAAGKKVWACGTTVLRALETAAIASHKRAGPLQLIQPFVGETSLFVKPGFKFQVVDALLTNFHQPQTSLLLLAAAFLGSRLDTKKALQKLKDSYQFAIEKKFRLFSYGDLTVTM